MKQQVKHNGTYHCPDCNVEYELKQEPRLNCEDCDGTLQPGPLLVLEPDDEEDSDDEA